MATLTQRTDKLCSLRWEDLEKLLLRTKSFYSEGCSFFVFDIIVIFFSIEKCFKKKPVEHKKINIPKYKILNMPSIGKDEEKLKVCTLLE